MENGVVTQDAHRLLTIVGFVVLNLVALREEDRGGFLALANLIALLVRLLVCHPSRVASLECPHIHAEDHDADAMKTASGYRVKRGLRPLAFVRVPISNPRLHTLLKLLDDAVGKLLHRVAAFGGFVGMALE